MIGLVYACFGMGGVGKMLAVAPSFQMLEAVEMDGGSSNGGGSGSNVGGVLGPPSVR